MEGIDYKIRRGSMFGRDWNGRIPGLTRVGNYKLLRPDQITGAGFGLTVFVVLTFVGGGIPSE